MSDEPRRAETIRAIMLDCEQDEPVAVRLTRSEAVAVCRMLWRFLSLEERKQVRQP